MTARGLAPTPRRLTSPQTSCGSPSPHARSCTGRARDGRPAARPRVLAPFGDVWSEASAPPLRFRIRFKRVDPVLNAPLPAAYHLTCLVPPTLPHCGAHQTSMPRSRGELPQYINRGHTAANHTLSATLVHGEGPRPSRTTADTLRPRGIIGCSAWPCQLIVDCVTATDARSRARGRRVFKEAYSAGIRMKAIPSRARQPASYPLTSRAFTSVRT